MLFVLYEKTALWNVAPCSLVQDERRFIGAYCLSYEGPEDGDSNLFETWINFYQAIQHPRSQSPSM